MSEEINIQFDQNWVAKYFGYFGIDS